MVDAPGQSDARPDSLARNFSAQLKGAFNLGGDLPTLSHIVEEKKHDIITQRHELHVIEARLEATEEALAEAGGGGLSDNAGAATPDVSKTEESGINTPKPPVSGAEIYAINPSFVDSTSLESNKQPSFNDVTDLPVAQRQEPEAAPIMPGQWQE